MIKSYLLKVIMYYNKKNSKKKNLQQKDINKRRFLRSQTLILIYIFLVFASSAYSCGSIHDYKLFFSNDNNDTLPNDTPPNNTLPNDTLPNPDTDGDLIDDSIDNCITIPNFDQLNHDNDSEGDLCDTDDDNDLLTDNNDSCPKGMINWTRNSSTDFDDDGCNDLTEDEDDDNDEVKDEAEGRNPGDNCLLLHNPGQEDTNSDGEGDSCDDTDNDGINDDTDPDIDGDGSENDIDVDDDNDGLIDIYNFEMLTHINYFPSGQAYQTSAGGTRVTTGGPQNATSNCSILIYSAYLCGYELVRNLDFSKEESYTGNTINPNWVPDDMDEPDNATNAGWIPLGTNSASLSSIFEGNGNTIRNLYVRHITNTNGDIGLFANLGTNAYVRNINIVNARIYGNNGNDKLGILLGENDTGSILSNIYVEGKLDGKEGTNFIGGIAGENNEEIRDSESNITINGGSGTEIMGGIVGRNFFGDITGSHSIANINGGSGTDHIGGLSGNNQGGEIIDSYSLGTLNGEVGNDNIGGLIGGNSGEIRNSYSSGVINGGNGNDNIGGIAGTSSSPISYVYVFSSSLNGEDGNDKIGGIAGTNTMEILDSYSLASIDGGAGNNDIGGIVGTNSSTITNSYYNNEMTITGGTVNSYGEGMTETQLQSPTVAGSATCTSCAYKGWSPTIWYFGTSSDYPQLCPSTATSCDESQLIPNQFNLLGTESISIIDESFLILEQNEASRVK